MTKSTVLFGIGLRAERFLIQYYNKMEICELFDNVKTGSFQGYSIKKPYYEKNVFIIVTVDDALSYFEIRKQLLELGYKEFEEFIPYTIYNKKIALAYGNCHMGAVRNFLECNKEFSQRYGFYPLPGICDMRNISDYEHILPYVELFLHQSIRSDNRYGAQFASCYMLDKLPKSCKVVAIPNLYGLPKCFFPQLDMSNRYKSKVFTYFFMDKNIVSWLKEGKSVDEIRHSILSGGIYSEKEILDMWKSFKEKLLLRECEWDIKISDYIFENYRKEKLFCDCNHITAKLAREIANRVLKYLGFRSEIILTPVGMDGLETFIYPDVKKAMGLEFDEEIIRQFSPSASCSGYEVRFEEYIEQICSYTLLVLDSEENGGTLHP